MRIVVVSQAPSQWQNPLFRFLAHECGMDLEVIFGAPEVPIDPELGHSPAWGGTASCEGFRSSVVSHERRALILAALRTAARRDIDVVVLPGWGTLLTRTFLAATLLLPRARQRTVVFSDATDLTTRSGVRSFARARGLKSLCQAGLHFAITGAAASRHLQRAGVHVSRIIVLPYVVDNDRLASDAAVWREQRDTLRAEIAGVHGPDDRVLLAVAKLVPREGADRVVRAFLAKASAHPSARLILVGDGPGRAAIEDLRRQPGGERVTLLGYQPYADLPRFYAAADWFVHLAEREPWGLSVNEAVACGLPIVCSTTVGSAEDLLNHGVNGFRVGNSDAEATRGIGQALDTSDAQLHSMSAASVSLSRLVHYRRWEAGLKNFVAQSA